MLSTNLNGSYHSAIIGLDAQWASQGRVQGDVDRVERALYSGQSSGQSSGQALGKTSGDGQGNTPAEDNYFTLQSSQLAIERMAKANQLSVADIKPIIVTEQSIAPAEKMGNTIVVDSLVKALSALDSFIKDHHLVALVGLSSVISPDFSPDISSRGLINQPHQHPKSTISFDHTFNGYQSCNGMVALLFSSIDFAHKNSCYVYSWLKGFAAGDSSTANPIAVTTKLALQNSAVRAADIGLLEVSALADAQRAKAESSALLASYQDKPLTTAISCARSVSGEGGGCSQILGLLRTVIALQQRYIPAISDWQQPPTDELALWQASNFYLAAESRPWFPHQDGSAHLAAYSCLAANDDYCHLVLEEAFPALPQKSKSTVVDQKKPANDIRCNGYLACSDLKMVIITADSEQALLSKVIELEQLVQSPSQSATSLVDIALSYYVEATANLASYTVALLAESNEALSKEIQLARSGIVLAFAKQTEWRTPQGSYFTPVPVNLASADDHNITFLYPGIGATYLGLGRDLFHLFPEIHQDVVNLADDIGASLKDTLLNPRSIIRPDFNALKALDLNLRGNLADIAEAGVGFACVFTQVFDKVFQIKADYAAGYSMGEVSMYAALGAWQQPGLMSARLAQSNTFNHRLSGDLLTLREHWGLGAKVTDEVIWETYTIKATLDEVIAASKGEERVYCTIINTPDSLLLAGYPEDCLRVINKLGVRAMPLNMANAIHCAPATKEYPDLVELYTMAVTPRITTKMYSSSCYLPVPQLSQAMAHSVAKCLCERVDFPRLINTLHDKGARVFIEMGPGRSLCSWVDKILDEGKYNSETRVTDKSSVSVPVNAKGTRDEVSYFRALAKLISHGVTLDLHALFYGSIIVQHASEKGVKKTAIKNNNVVNQAKV